MTIYDWAGLLTVDDRQSKSREDFVAICPCHGDSHASLHVYVGRETGQVVLKCHACGATGKQVCEALGVDLKELYCDAYSGERSKVIEMKLKSAPAKGKKRVPCQGLYKEKDVWKDGFEIKAVYEYQDREGRIVLRKARREKFDEEKQKKKKSFAMQSIGVDEKWYPDAGIYVNLLYHLPEVLENIECKGTIIIAEGEKDVDNLRKLGFTATCGLCGGGTGKLEGKWNDDHVKQLEGAERVIVIPDYDAAGEELAQRICKSLQGHVGEVKLLRISDHCMTLPEKGDFTDWVDVLKASGPITKSDLLAKMNSMIDEAPVWTKDNVRKFEKKGGDGDGASGTGGSGGDGGGDDESYFGLTGYCIKNGCLARVIKDGAMQLCSFLPIPKETIVYDDGGDVLVEYVIGGKAANGMPLADAVVKGEAELMAMRWPMKYWQHWGNIKPGRNMKEMVLDAINCAGQQESKHRMVYGHTGMRKVGGKWCYLHAGGAIGAENVSVRLDGPLAYYDLSEMMCSAEDAAVAEMILINMIPARIIYPLLAQAYLAPLYSVLEEMQEPPSYVVFLIGAPGAGKSTVAGYVQAHFGDFYVRRFPSNFADTANVAREKAFWAKDALYTVDDYVPNRDGGRVNGADMVANAVISAVADRAERGGLSADKTLRAARPARCTCVMTGEDLPKLTTSRQMRLYRIDIQAGEIAKDMSELSTLRDFARLGYFRVCMRGYIESLLARWDGIKDELRDRLDRASDEARKRLTRSEGRFVEASMHLMMGVELMLDYLTENGMLDEAERALRYETACAAIAANMDEQGRGIDSTKPDAMWLATLASLVNTGSVSFRDRNELSSGEVFRTGMIGYKDEKFYYVVAPAADEAIRERLRKGGVELGVSSQSIYRLLAAGGHVFPTYDKGTGGIKDPQKNLKIGGRTVRLLWIHRWVIDGGKPPEADKGKAGFTPADGEQLPIEFTNRQERSDRQ